MSKKAKSKLPEAQNPLILRCHRLMEAFAKSDDERDFYLDRVEGFIVYVNLDKTEEELQALHNEIESDPERYVVIPKLTFFESKKIMEGFVNEKVYDIDTKEKLLDIIQSKEAREHFLEFIYDHLTELEKWQQFYQERSRIRIIEWLRKHHLHFVFEEDLDLATSIIEKLKENLFETKVPREIEVARKALNAKSKSYYSNEALNPRPKRGRPPKQQQKVEMEPQITTDIYTTVPLPVRPFLFTPEITSASEVTFSSKFESGQELLAHSKINPDADDFEESMQDISQKLAALRKLSSHWVEKENGEIVPPPKKEKAKAPEPYPDFDDEEKELFQKLEDRKKAIQKRQETPSKASAKRQPIRTKTVKQLVLKSERPQKAKEAVESKATNKAPTPKRIISKDKKEPAQKKPVKVDKKETKSTPKRLTRKAKASDTKPSIISKDKKEPAQKKPVKVDKKETKSAPKRLTRKAKASDAKPLAKKTAPKSAKAKIAPLKRTRKSG